MASAIRKLTGVGGDVRKIARLLQKKAPPGHMLAYINQEEADLLKARGGSGKPHEDTGIPSYKIDFDEFDYSTSGDFGSTSGGEVPTPQTNFAAQYPAYPNVQPPAQAELTGPDSGYYRPISAQVATTDAFPFGNYAAAPSGSTYLDQTLSERYLPPAATPSPAAAAQAPDKDLLGQVGDYFKDLTPDTKKRLGIGGVQALLGAYQTSQAIDQARKYREDLAAMARPYQEEGKRLIARAQGGELAPAAQQQLQAAQAQAAQGVQARGGVGAQQAMMAVENMRQQLLQNQYDYGLKISGIGDQIATGAIKAGMQADQYVNSMAASYANNIARLLAGQSFESSTQPSQAQGA